jgi:hypothetical protein
MELVIVTADTNDADYVTQQQYIRDEKELVELKRILGIIKAKTKSMGKWSHNWPTSDYVDQTVQDLYKGVLTEEEIEWFSGYVPYGEFGVHTITSVVVYHVEKEEKLFEIWP